MNTSLQCESCQKPKANFQCGICEISICKNCAQFLEEGAFSFYANVPDELSKTSYCDFCYGSVVLPEQEKYQELMAQAKQVFVFFKTRKKAVPLLRKSKEPFQIKNCPDRDETILRLGFLAAEQGFNGIIEVAVDSKVISGSGRYQKREWFGSGVAAEINVGKLEAQDLQDKIYT